jgi:hypothetical protein
VIDPELPEESPDHLSERTLREFAGLCLAIFGAFFAVSWYRHRDGPSPAGWVAGALAVLAGAQGLVRPNTLRPVYFLAMALTRPIGHLIGVGLLAFVYYVVIAPLAVAFRVAGRDGLGRFRAKADSYWIDRVPCHDVRLYLRQYQPQSPLEDVRSRDSRLATSGRTGSPATVSSGSKHQSQALSGADHGRI